MFTRAKVVTAVGPADEAGFIEVGPDLQRSTVGRGAHVTRTQNALHRTL